MAFITKTVLLGEIPHKKLVDRHSTIVLCNNFTTTLRDSLKNPRFYVCTRDDIVADLRNIDSDYKFMYIDMLVFKTALSTCKLLEHLRDYVYKKLGSFRLEAYKLGTTEFCNFSDVSDGAKYIEFNLESKKITAVGFVFY